MIFDRTPMGAQVDVIEAWLQSVGEVQEHANGLTVALTTEMLRDYAEWVAAYQRETIAQVLESMDDGVQANRCADAVRKMRVDH